MHEPRFAKYEDWIASLPKCISDEGGCDGDLVGLPHESDAAIPSLTAPH